MSPPLPPWKTLIKHMITRETWARQHWTRNPSIGCPKGQVMRGILKGIKHLPNRRSDWSALNNPHNRKLQDYAKLTRSEQGQRANRKYMCYLDSQNMHHLTKTILVKSVIDTMKIRAPKTANTRTRRHPSSPLGTRMSFPPPPPPPPPITETFKTWVTKPNPEAHTAVQQRSVSK